MFLLQTGGLHDYGKGERVHFTHESVRGPLFFRGTAYGFGVFLLLLGQRHDTPKGARVHFFAIFANQESKKNHYEEIHYSYDCCACCGVF